jgi:glycosyltransferase involved in cell wall biosynthesis
MTLTLRNHRRNEIMTIKAQHEKLTVLHIATLNQPIIPNLGYGPIETVLYNIDKGLHSVGHRSIVACSGDSRVTGEHYVTVDQSIGDYWTVNTSERRKTMLMHLSKALGRAKMGDIDIVHTHDAKAVEFMYDSALRTDMPIVMTLHVSAKDSLLEGAYQRWCNPVSSPLVHCAAISEYQKRQYRNLVNAEDVVYHGIDVEGFPVKEAPDKGSYLFTIGRITSDKGQDKAIELAKRTGSKLVIAGCVQNKVADMEYFASLKNSIDLSVEVGKYPVDNNYYAGVIQPLLDSDKQIIYIGEISSEHKKQWYRHARATVFPIQWGEPFGLVLIESMACGTPVIAFNKGAVPEIIVDGKTGFVVDSMNAMLETVGRIDSIDPVECRRHVWNNFSIKKMAYNYSEIYHRIIDRHKTSEIYRSEAVSYISKPLNHGPVAI